MSQTTSKSLRADSHHPTHRPEPVATKPTATKPTAARPTAARPTAAKLATGRVAEIPSTATRVLKMRARRDDIDEIDRPAQKLPKAGPKPASKSQQKWATLTQQLKNCLAKYELLQKQVLCAELTTTEMPNQDKFEHVAQQLLGQITSLRKQLAEIRKSTIRKPAAANSQVPHPATVNSQPASALKVQATNTVAAVANVPQKQRQALNHNRRTVQLSVGNQTAQILKAFADAGKSPSALVERALWQDKDVRDAALLLRLKPPIR